MAKHFGKRSTSNAIAAVAASRMSLAYCRQAIAERPERQLNVDLPQNPTSTLPAN
jgi:hypothetical protein